MIIIIIKRQYRQSTNMIDAVVLDDVGEWGLMFLMCAVATECA